jgi:hypothetical protein
MFLACRSLITARLLKNGMALVHSLKNATTSLVNTTTLLRRGLKNIPNRFERGRVMTLPLARRPKGRRFLVKSWNPVGKRNSARKRTKKHPKSQALSRMRDGFLNSGGTIPQRGITPRITNHESQITPHS